MLVGSKIAFDRELLKRLRKNFGHQGLKDIKTRLFKLMVDPAPAAAKAEYKKHDGFYSLDLTEGKRAVLAEVDGVFIVVYVGNRDDADRWVSNRRIEIHPQTQEILIYRPIKGEEVVKNSMEAPFRRYSIDYLYSLGVPREYIEPLRMVAKDRVQSLIESLPELVQERIFALLENKPVPSPLKVRVQAPILHPSNRYRYWLISSKEELERALFSDWEDWMIFLHPAQRIVVDQNYRGPAKVTGAAGTGKTVVAIHRAVRLAEENPGGHVLLTTYTRTLADVLREGVFRLAGKLRNLEVEHFDRLLARWCIALFDRKHSIARDDQIKAALNQARKEVGVPRWASDLFLFNEWLRVLDAWGIRELKEYITVDRTGRGMPLTQSRRQELWPVFERAREILSSQGLETWGGRTRTLLENLDKLPRYDHVVVDETQDLSPIQLKLLRAIVPEGENDLFLVGDAAQRIYQTRVPWRWLGIETVGRSQRLWVNYRTTREVADFAEKILPEKITEAEGEEVSPKALSIRSGEPPLVQFFSHPLGEATVLANWLEALIKQGYKPEEIVVVARTKRILKERGELAVERAELPHWYLEERGDGNGVRLATMHRVKGLEFRAVAVIGVEDGIVPLKTALNQAETEADRDAQLELERQLLFVALSRAREKLWVSGVGARSPFLPASSLP